MEHKHLFILTPPFSGSTLLLRLLGTSSSVSSFDVPKGEGMLIPELSGFMTEGRWDPEKKLSWDHIRQVFERHWDLSRPVLLEKGPANLLRAADIEASFEAAHFLVMMRDPYAWCESMARRAKGEDAKQDMRAFAARWLEHARWQQRNMGLRRVLLFSYEELCDKTHDVIRRIQGFIPEIGTLDATAEFKVHSTLGKARNPIINTNALALARLDAGQIADISAVLREHPGMLEYFGYPLRGTKA